MTYKVLISGKDPQLMRDLFMQMKQSFNCISTSDMLDDIIAHLDLFQPDAYICFYEKTDSGTSKQLELIKSILENKGIKRTHIVVIGDKAACDELLQNHPDVAGLVIRQPAPVQLVEKELFAYLSQEGKESDAKATSSPSSPQQPNVPQPSVQQPSVQQQIVQQPMGVNPVGQAYYMPPQPFAGMPGQPIPQPDMGNAAPTPGTEPSPWAKFAYGAGSTARTTAKIDAPAPVQPATEAAPLASITPVEEENPEGSASLEQKAPILEDDVPPPMEKKNKKQEAKKHDEKPVFTSDPVPKKKPAPKSEPNLDLANMDIDYFLKTAMKTLQNVEIKKHILVVDDDKTVLKMLKAALEDVYNVTTMVNGDMAQKYLESKTTDLILLDYEMPMKSGSQVFRELKSKKRTKNIPVIFLTGVSDADRIKEVLALKPRNYLLKPIDVDKLRKVIAEVFSKK